MHLIERLKSIRTFVLDIDGVLTDSKLLVLPDGSMARSFSTKDGYAMKVATRSGYHIWVCSGGHTLGMEERFASLGVIETHMKVTDKLAVVQSLASKHKIALSEIAFLGDDVPDLEAMTACGLAACPADAADDVALRSHYRSDCAGGEAFVRDVIEKVMRVRGDWPI